MRLAHLRLHLCAEGVYNIDGVGDGDERSCVVDAERRGVLPGARLGADHTQALLREAAWRLIEGRIAIG